MIKFNPTWLISLIVYIISFLCIIIFSKIFTKKIDEEKYSFARIFPFETINNMPNFYKAFKIILFVFTGLCFSLVFSIPYILDLYSNLKIIFIIDSCLFGLSGIVCSFLFFFNPSNVKTHIWLVSILFQLILFASLLSASIGISLYKMDIDTNLINLTLGVLSIFILICLIVEMIFIRLKNWTKLENDNGQIKRPKVFPLALFEWSLFIVLFIEEIVFFFTLVKY